MGMDLPTDTHTIPKLCTNMRCAWSEMQECWKPAATTRVPSLLCLPACLCAMSCVHVSGLPAGASIPL
jgi:hypothetical protein